MENKLQELTNKLYQEGLAKGKDQAEEIIAKAKEEAEAIVKKAKKEATWMVERAEKEAAEHKENKLKTWSFSNRWKVPQKRPWKMTHSYRISLKH